LFIEFSHIFQTVGLANFHVLQSIDRAKFTRCLEDQQQFIFSVYCVSSKWQGASECLFAGQGPKKCEAILLVNYLTVITTNLSSHAKGGTREMKNDEFPGLLQKTSIKFSLAKILSSFKVLCG
jgi:hypothetical protein